MSVKKYITCPRCREKIKLYKNPLPTVDIIIELMVGIVLIERRNLPYGWALPGGFIDYGESAEDAAVREALEETGLKVSLQSLLGVYSSPDRDPRHHTISAVFIASSEGMPKAGDDALKASVFSLDELPRPLVFDHKEILEDYKKIRSGEKYPCFLNR
jgi:ADP-ribose pyrophosphatase YjhB (NUDIX family)